MRTIDGINKHCFACQRWLTVDKFGKDKYKVDGLDAACRDCERIRRKAQHIKYREDRNRSSRIYYHNIKINALSKVGVGKIECVNCGCDMIECLEINHINGGGTKETELDGRYKFWRDIVFGRRKTDDLNILCRTCNTIHYVERELGRKLPWEIQWCSNTYHASDTLLSGSS